MVSDKQPERSFYSLTGIDGDLLAPPGGGDDNGWALRERKQRRAGSVDSRPSRERPRRRGSVMDEEASFLRQIVASPGEDVARLVYADWLEERGDPRGEYLRLHLQVEAAVRRMADLREGVDPSWLAATSTRLLILLRPTERTKAINVRRGTLLIGRDGRCKESVDRELSTPGSDPVRFVLHLRDLAGNRIEVERYHPAEEVEVVRVLTEFEWDES
jgi:uncharacterized protein (TIGR02996 family)